jgi:hypothetical protein
MSKTHATESAQWFLETGVVACDRRDCPPPLPSSAIDEHVRWTPRLNIGVEYDRYKVDFNSAWVRVLDNETAVTLLGTSYSSVFVYTETSVENWSISFAPYYVFPDDDGFGITFGLASAQWDVTYLFSDTWRHDVSMVIPLTPLSWKGFVGLKPGYFWEQQGAARTQDIPRMTAIGSLETLSSVRWLVAWTQFWGEQTSTEVEVGVSIDL